MNAFENRHIEALEILSGERQGPRDNAAVRIVDFSDLMQIDQFQSVELNAAPTMEDFNKLVRDARKISQALNAVALAIGKRKIRR